MPANTPSRSLEVATANFHRILQPLSLPKTKSVGLPGVTCAYTCICSVPSVTLYLEAILRSSESNLPICQLVLDRPAEFFMVFRLRLARKKSPGMVQQRSEIVN